MVKVVKKKKVEEEDGAEEDEEEEKEEGSGWPVIISIVLGVLTCVFITLAGHKAGSFYNNYNRQK